MLKRARQTGSSTCSAWSVTPFRIFIGVILVFLALSILLATMRDPPRNFALSDPADLAAIENLCAQLGITIASYEKDIEKNGSASFALDADRYWPLDMDMTVLAMERFRLSHDRLPESWYELLASDEAKSAARPLSSVEQVNAYWRNLHDAGVLIGDSVIHGDWELHKTPEGWTIELSGWGRIAKGN